MNIKQKEMEDKKMEDIEVMKTIHLFKITIGLPIDTALKPKNQ